MPVPPPSNHSPQPSASTRQDQPTASQKRSAEEQASSFTENMKKKKGKGNTDKADEKKEKDTKNKPSLSSLLAEQSRHSREASQRFKDQGENSGGDGEAARQMMQEQQAIMMDAKIQKDMQMMDVQQVKSVKEVNATLQKMADQIQVSAKDAVNGAEIRISLKENILPGTEIRINRHGGELTVTLNTTSAESHNFLAQHRASLEQTLMERFGNDAVKVDINMSGSGGEQSDGRSRNEYVAEENNNDSDQQTG